MLDWFSDIGGIQTILISFIGIFVYFWNYNLLDNFLASKLYKTRQKERVQSLKVSSISGFRDYICELLPDCCKCCAPSRNERGLDLGRKNLEIETNIVHIIQQCRYFSSAVELLLP